MSDGREQTAQGRFRVLRTVVPERSGTGGASYGDSVQQLLIVFSNARDGREDEFDDWYTHVHLRDVLRGCPGAVAARRFHLAPEQVAGSTAPHYRYLAVYLGDHRGFTDGHRARIFSDEMPVSASFAVEDHRAAYYLGQLGTFSPDLDADRDSEPAGLLVERLGTDGADVGSYGALRFPTLLRTPGVQSGILATTADHQLFPQHRDTQHVALYPVADRAAAVAVWPTASPDQDPGPASEVACYVPLIPWITAGQVRAPSPAERRRSDEARARVVRLAGPARPTSSQR